MEEGHRPEHEASFEDFVMVVSAPWRGWERHHFGASSEYTGLYVNGLWDAGCATGVEDNDCFVIVKFSIPNR